MRSFQISGFLVTLFLAICGLTVSQCTNGTNPKMLPVDESYKPDQPIEFPHDIHVSKGIDCKYCHDSANDGKTDGIPTANLCLKCHKQITRDSL